MKKDQQNETEQLRQTVVSGWACQTLDGEQIEIHFSQIGNRFPHDDVFYYEGNGDSVPCLLSSLVQLPCH